jgi:hypothetical protein
MAKEATPRATPEEIDDAINKCQAEYDELAQRMKEVNANGELFSDEDVKRLGRLAERLKALKKGVILPETPDALIDNEEQMKRVRQIKRKLDLGQTLTAEEAQSLNGFIASFRDMMLLNAPELLQRRALTILLERAVTDSPITYEELARQIGVPHTGNALGRALTPILTHILHWCQERGMPPLTALVVRKSGTMQGLPSPMYFSLMGITAPTRAGKGFLSKMHATHLEAIRNFFSMTLTQTKDQA